MKRLIALLCFLSALLSIAGCSGSVDADGAGIPAVQNQNLAQHWTLPVLDEPGSTCSWVPTSALERGAIVTYASSDDSVATVDGNGVITAVSPGEVVITVTVEENGTTIDHTADIVCEWE